MINTEEVEEEKSEEKKSLYVSRKVKNTKEIINFAKSQGIEKILDEKDLHITLAYSKDLVDWDSFEKNEEEIEISLENATVIKLGDSIALSFQSDVLKKSWQKFIDFGASWDYEGFTPHISLSYYNENVNVSKMEKFNGKITFEKEIFEEIDEEWQEEREETPFQFSYSDTEKCRKWQTAIFKKEKNPETGEIRTIRRVVDTVNVEKEKLVFFTDIKEDEEREETIEDLKIYKNKVLYNEFSKKVEDYIYIRYSEKKQAQDIMWFTYFASMENKSKETLEKIKKIKSRIEWAKNIIEAFKTGETPPEFPL